MDKHNLQYIMFNIQILINIYHFNILINILFHLKPYYMNILRHNNFLLHINIFLHFNNYLHNNLFHFQVNQQYIYKFQNIDLYNVYTYHPNSIYNYHHIYYLILVKHNHHYIYSHTLNLMNNLMLIQNNSIHINLYSNLHNINMEINNY